MIQSNGRAGLYQVLTGFSILVKLILVYGEGLIVYGTWYLWKIIQG